MPLRVLAPDKAYFLVATMMGGASPLLLAPLQTRQVGVQEYGQIVLAATIAGLAASILGLGLSQAAVGYSRRDDIGVAALQRLPVRSWLLTTSVSAIAIALVELFVRWVGPDFSETTIVASIVVGYGLARNRLNLEVLRALGLAKTYAALSGAVLLVAPAIASAILIIAPTAQLYVVCWALGLILIDGLHTLWMFKRSRERKACRETDLRLTEMIRFGSPLALHALVGAGVLFNDRVALGALLGPRDVGEFQLAYLAGLAIVQVSNGLNVWWLPRQVSAGPEDARKSRETMLAELSLLHAAGLVALVIGIPFMAVVLGLSGPTSSHFVVGALLLSAAAASQPLYIAGCNALYYEGSTARIALVSSSANVMQGCVTWLAVPMIGVLGAVFAVFISQWAQAIWVGRRLYAAKSPRLLLPTVAGIVNIITALAVAGLTAMKINPFALDGIVVLSALAIVRVYRVQQRS